MLKNSRIMSEKTTIADIVKKRRNLWRRTEDIVQDRQFVRAAAVKILETKSLVAEVKDKPYLLIEATFSIVDKQKKTVPFFFNDVQKDFIRKLEKFGTKKPFFILKGRQQGFTTLITAIQLSYAIVQKNFSGFTMADRADNTQAIFNDKARVVYDRLPSELKPSEKFNSRNEMFFDKLNSSWRIATATDQVGRSRTLNFVHFSEVAFFECSLASLQKGIGEALTNNAIIVYETTANGFNEAKDLWDSEACVNLFYEWWRTGEYRSKEYSYLENADGWLSQRIKQLQKLGLEKDQICWYAQKYKGYLDKSSIRQEYPCSPEEAFVASGESIFGAEIVGNRLLELKGYKPLRRGYFDYRRVCKPVFDSYGEKVDEEWKLEDIRFIESEELGYIDIHEEPRTKKDSAGNVTHIAPYAIGGDTAGSGEDFFTAKVVSSMTGKTAATLRKQSIDEDIYAEQLLCLAKMYNDALIGVEINYSRVPMRTLANKYNYPNLYLRERIDKITDTTVKDYGFNTTSKTKPIIIGELVGLLREDMRLESDVNTLKEMLTFVKTTNGGTEAMSGCHDDLVMALAIAHFVAKQGHRTWIQRKEDNDFINSNFHLNNVSGGGLWE